jgi:uncharacterized protein YjiS (DUF1127 family)
MGACKEVIRPTKVIELMEPKMPGNRTLDFTHLDYWSLTPLQREALVQRIIREAHAEQARAIRAGLRTSVVWLRKLVVTAGTALARLGRAYADQRRYRRQMAELHALSDYELKDIGLRRSEIYWVVHHGREIPAARAPEQRHRIIRPDPVTTSARPPEPKRRGKDTPAAA